MKFSRLYNESKLFWPSEIPIEDGELREGNGGYFPSLSLTWQKAESAQHKINDWHEIMSWVIFCGFYKAACEHLKSGNLSPVKISELDQPYMATRVIESLSIPYGSWPKYMRGQFKNDTTS